MQLHQYRTDGHIDVTELAPRDAACAKLTALNLVAHPQVTGVFRIKFVDAEYDRVTWDTYELADTPRLGELVGFRSHGEAVLYAAQVAA